MAGLSSVEWPDPPLSFLPLTAFCQSCFDFFGSNLCALLNQRGRRSIGNNSAVCEMATRLFGNNLRVVFHRSLDRRRSSVFSAEENRSCMNPARLSDD